MLTALRKAALTSKEKRRHCFWVTVWQTTYLDFCTDPERITCWSSNPFDGRVFSEFSMVDRLRLTLLSVASTYQTEFNYRHMPAAAWVQRNLGKDALPAPEADAYAALVVPGGRELQEDVRAE